MFLGNFTIKCTDKGDIKKIVWYNRIQGPCCGVTFHLVEYPFFIDMVKSLCLGLGYNPSCAFTLSENFLYEELANIVVD